MFTKSQEKGIRDLFGNPMELQHRIKIFVPKKIGKMETRAFCAPLFSRMVKAFGSCSTYEYETSFFVSGKEVREDQYVLESAFGEKHLKNIKEVRDHVLALIFAFDLKGIIIQIDNDLYFLEG